MAGAVLRNFTLALAGVLDGLLNLYSFVLLVAILLSWVNPDPYNPVVRFVRSATLQAVGQDHVRTGAAKGLTRNAALIRHGLPDVGLSVITVLGLQVAGIIVGAVIIEQLFTLPGIGRMLVADVSARDLPKVQGELLVLTGFVLIIGFVVDLTHRLIDPRQREAT